MAQYNHDFKVDTEDFEIGVDTAAGHGYFEHHVEGDAIGGELIFMDGLLIDYDGVCELPKEITEALRKGGFTVLEGT